MAVATVPGMRRLFPSARTRVPRPTATRTSTSTLVEMDHLEHGRECYGRRAWGDAYHALLLRRSGNPARRRRSRPPGDCRVSDRSRPRVSATSSNASIVSMSSPATGRAPRAVRSGLRSPSCFAERSVGRTPGRREASGSSRTTTASSAATWPLLSPSSNCARDTPMPRMRPQARPSRSESRFGDADLTAAARHAQGRALIQQGDVVAGLKRLDETMLAVVAGELFPIMTGVDVLQRDRHLPAGLCPGPRSRMDVRVFERVRATAGDGRVHRHLPGASCRDHAIAGGVAGRADRSLPCV